MNATATQDSLAPDARTVELIIFFVDNLVCALDIAEAQEIKGQLTIVEVPETAISVRGVANLRGQVITVVDLRIVFGVEPKAIDKDSRIVVARTEHGVVGLLVDYVDDIVSAPIAELQPAPANVSGVEGELFDAVYRREGDLACVLNVEKILKQE
jgi:purine-binding chemotaxis protein CheW